MLAASAAAAPVFRAGPRRVALLELYSSEGCSSCPPADAWVSGFVGAPGLFKDFVPVVFHVDYWDRLGWKDRFASPDWTARQRRLAASNSGDVYTPGVYLDGREWRAWGSDAPKDEGDAGKLEVKCDAARRCALSYESRGAKGLVAHAALLGLGLSSEVASGENAGRALRHDFVVLAYGDQRLDDTGNAMIAVPPDLREKARRHAVAFWVSDGTAVLQSAGGLWP